MSAIGTCAVCQQEKEVAYCSVCGKWLCQGCRVNIPARIKAAIVELF